MLTAEDYQKNIKKIEDLTAVQCAEGNWNHNPYMHGMANGMILALAVMKNEEPKYLEAPEVWLKDVPREGQPVVEKAMRPKANEVSSGSI